MKSFRFVSYWALGFAVAGCAGNPATLTQSSAPAAKAPIEKPETSVLPDRIAAVPDEQISVSAGDKVPETIDLAESVGQVTDTPAQSEIVYTDVVEAQPLQTVQALPYEAFGETPSEIVGVPEALPPQYLDASAHLGWGQMAPIRDDPVDDIPNAAPTRASSYNIAALKANYHASEALGVSAPPARIRNTPSEAFGQELSTSALARLNPNVAYVADYKKIGYPWGDVSEETGVCTDVVIRSYRSLGIDLQSMVHEDMRRAFSAYPSRKIYGLKKADPNIDHRRVVNLEAFFERVGAAIPLGSDYQPGDVITWRLSGGEPHIGVVVNRIDPRTGNPLIVHNLGAGVRAEDLLDFATPHGAYRFAPDQQSRMASLALKQSI